MTGRGAMLAAALLALMTGAGGGAAAQSCGQSVRVQPGDTLARIAGRCGTTVGAIVAANPRITDPARIGVGWELAMPGAYAGAPLPDPYGNPPAPDPYGGAVARTQAPAPQQVYRVAPGDTVGGIAEALGLTIAQILAANAGLDPQLLFPGQSLNLPGGRDYRDNDWRYRDRDYRVEWPDDDGRRDWRRSDLHLDIARRSAKPGEKIEIRADGLRNREKVTLGVAARGDEFVRIGTAKASKGGTVKTNVTVPDWARPSDRLVFALRRANGEVLEAAPVRVVGARSDARLVVREREAGPGDKIEIRADGLRKRERVTLGVAARGRDFVEIGTAKASKGGTVKTNVKMPDWVRPRDRVIFAVRRGNGEVLESEPVSVTRARGDGSRIEGWVVRGTECPLLRTRDGKSFALLSDRRLPLGAYVEVTGPRVERSYCQEGRASIEVRDVRRITPPG